MNDRQHLMYWVHALTPLHVGAGRGEGHIDLPLMREGVTKYPFVPGSSVKGVFADVHGATDDARRPSTDQQPNPKHDRILQAAFGRAGDDHSNAGALAFTDARLVCLPVQSLYGTCAWCTCPFVLNRLIRDLEAVGIPLIGPPPKPEKGRAIVPDLATSKLCVSNEGKSSALLLDLDFTVSGSPIASSWATKLAEWIFPDKTWQDLFLERFIVVDDDTFSFLATTATEVQPHIRIEPDTKTVMPGALWYEESLPAESILAGIVWCDRVFGVSDVKREEVLGLCKNRTGQEAVQIGGKASVGKGRCNLSFTHAQG